jgi:hypothetical protein
MNQFPPKIAAQGAPLVSLPPVANVKNLQSEKFHYFVGTPFLKYRKLTLVRNTRNTYNRDVNEDYWMTHIYKLDMMSCANIYSSTNLQYLQYIYLHV